jgi:hypothetical protein
MNATVLSLVLATVLAPPATTSAQRSTRIYVRTTPPGASIILDGKELGKSDGLFLVPSGVRTITLEMDGHDPEAKTVDVKEGWITRVEVRMARKEQSPDKAAAAVPAGEVFYFVRWVIQNEKTMTFEGEPVTLDQLPSLLEKVPNRSQTVLEVGYSSDISVKQRNEFVARAGGFARKLCFNYASDIGEQKLGSKGSPPKEVRVSEKGFDRTIHDLDEGQGQEALDLDTGTLYDVPKEIEKWEPARWSKWFEERGIDLITDHASSQWALGLVPPAVTLVPADDVKLHEANERVANVLKEKEDRLREVTIHHDEGIDFHLLPTGSRPPLSFAFRTAAGTEGFLQIVELNETEPKSMRLRWKVTKRANEDPDPDSEFATEFTVAVRAGRGDLADDEKESLQQQNHPLLGQLADPNTAKLIRFFARLPDEIHERLKKHGYVKWKFANLSEENQKIVRDIIQLNIDMTRQQGGTPQPGLNVEALALSQTGFAAVEIEKTDQKVVSWFILMPELPNPIWVTVVNAKAAGTQPYFQAHLSQLPLLRDKPETEAVAAATFEGFEPVRHLFLHDDSTKAASMVDLDTGELFEPPSRKEVERMSGEEWMAGKGIDAGCETNAAAPGLWGIDMVVLPVINDAWEKATVEAIEGELRDGKPGSPAIMSALGGLPRTFYFATREGGKGILQITAQTKDGQGEAFESRYRLISP